MYLLLKIVSFYCYVSLPEGICFFEKQDVQFDEGSFNT